MANSNDDLTPALVAQAGTRVSPERAEVLRRLQMLHAEKQTSAEQPEKVDPKEAAVKATLAKPEESPGFLRETGRAVFGGVRDAAQATLDFVDDSANWLNDNFINLRTAEQQRAYEAGNKGRAVLPEVEKNQSTAGNIARSITQFAVPFSGYLKALKGAKMGLGMKGAVAGAATDATAFDPHEKRLSNFILDITDQNPLVGESVFRYLAAQPGDTAAEGRVKNVLEGLGIGAGVELALRGLKLWKATKLEQGKDPVAAVRESALPVEKPAAATPEATAQVVLDKAGAKRGEPLHTVPVDGPKYPGGIDFEPTASRNVADDILRDSQLRLEEEVRATQPMTADRAEAGLRERIHLSREGNVEIRAPEGNSIPLEDQVKAALERPGFERTADDLVALRAYRDLQEAAAKQLEVVTGGNGAVFTDAERAVARTPLILRLEGNGSVLDDATRATIRQESDQLATEIAQRNAALARATADAAERDVRAANSRWSSNVEEANARLVAAAGLRSQQGFVTPELLMRLWLGGTKGEAASGVAGGVVGFNAAPENAPLSEKMGYAAVGALGGRGVYRMVRPVAKTPEEVVVADSLSRPEVAAIAPKAWSQPVDMKPKATPRVKGAKVDAMVEAIKSKKVGELARQLDESDFNLDKIDTHEDVKTLLDGFSKMFERELDLAKHGVQSFGDIKALARELGAGTDSLKALYQDTDNLAARVFAHRTLLAASAEKIRGLADIAVRGDVDAQLALRKHVALHATLQAEMKGVQTEVARALSQFRMTSTSVDLVVNERNALIEAMGGEKLNKEFAEKLSQITDPAQLNAVIRKGALARSQDAIFEAWVNGLLSSPVTHAVNVVGNSLVAIGSVAERLGAAAIGRVFRDARGAIAMGEVKAYTYGMMEGLKDALHISANGLRTLGDAASAYRAGDVEGARRMVAESGDMGGAWKTFATDTPVLDNAAFGTRQYELQTPSITAENLPRLAQFVGQSTVDHLGVLIRAPGRVLATTDELFKTVLYRGELKAQAYRKAVGEGLQGDDLFRRVAELIEDPTPEIAGTALKAARDGTFTSPLGKAGSSAQAFVANFPGLRYIMPFVRTPINILKHVYDRTPFLNLVQEQNRAIFAAGGPQAHLLEARWALGGGLFALGAYLSAQGTITGGGMEKLRGAEKLGGIQPYSIKVGDTYYSFNRMDPLGMFLGIAADFQTISGHLSDTERDKLAAAAVLSIQKNLVSKSYLQGLVQFIDDVAANGANPKTIGRWIDKQAGTIVPAWMNQLRKEVDPEVKELWGMIDSIKSRIPGLSKDVPAHVNLFGEDVHYQGGLGPDIASPIAQMKISDDPAAKEIARLNVDLKHPLREIGGGDGSPSIELTPKQYYRLMKILGKEVGNGGFHGEITRLVESPGYKALPEDPTQTQYRQSKETAIRLVYEEIKRAAVATLIGEDKELREKFVQHLRNKGSALQGQPIVPIN